MNIGIVGHGFVGRATALYACQSKVNVIIYDTNPELCVPLGLQFDDLGKCDIVFVCVPTPATQSGDCHLGIVEKVVRRLKIMRAEQPNANFNIFIKSTVPPGTCNRLGTHHMPEFLTEANAETDFKTCDNWIVGLNQHAQDDDKALARCRLTQLTETAQKCRCIDHSKIHFVTCTESETIKYARNTYLAVKVAFFNEIYDMCRSFHDVDFDNVRNLIAADKRIGFSHTQVPGPDGKRGFGGTCLPKDIAALVRMYDMKNIPCYILQATQNRNNKLDRIEQDWKQDAGRAFI